MPYDLLLKRGTVILRGGPAEADVAVLGGRIVEIGRIDEARAKDVVDCAGLTVLPGCIDTQVHFREPGMEHKEDLHTGSRAAVMGGITTVFEMPNTSPPTTTRKAVEDKLARAKGRMYCDHAFFVGATEENAEELGALERLPGVCGVKVFMGSSTGSLLVADDAGVRNVLRHISRRAAFHCEDEERLEARKKFRKPGDPSTHPVWRDADTAYRATERLLRLAQAEGRRVHVLHVTTADELPLLMLAKDFATFEVTPHHLTLTDECYRKLGTLCQMNPPVRGPEHRAALWHAVNSGLVDVIGSDHAPHTLEEKAKPYPESPSGMVGVQTTLPIMLDHVNAGRLSLLRLVDLLCYGPARIYGIAAKGAIAPGYDADFTIVDMRAERTISNDWIASKAGWTPYDGKRVKGWPAMTIVRGQIVMREGEIVADTPTGRPARFVETLMPAQG